MERKIFILDTNVLIHNPQALFSFFPYLVLKKPQRATQ